MPILPTDFGAAVPIDGYGPGFFRVAEVVRPGGLAIHAGGAAPWGGWEDLAPVAAMAGAVDVLFVGTGAEIAHPPAAFRRAIEAMGLAIEPMSSPSAARTYNVLLSEGRRIGAVLLPLPGDPPAPR